MLEVAIISDDALVNSSRIIDFKSLRSAERSHSFLGLYGWLAKHDFDANWWWDVWAKSEWPKDAQVYRPTHLDEAVMAVGRRYDLAKVSDPEGLTATLGEFSQMLSIHGFTLVSVPNEKAAKSVRKKKRK